MLDYGGNRGFRPRAASLFPAGGGVKTVDVSIEEEDFMKKIPVL